MKDRSLRNEIVKPEPCISGCGKLAYPGSKCPSCSEVKDPDRCPTCNGKYDFVTDAFGRVRPIHPVTKCVPRVEVFREERTWENALEVRECKDCGEDFPVFQNQQLKTRCDECRVRLNAERNRQTAKASNERKAA